MSIATTLRRVLPFRWTWGGVVEQVGLRGANVRRVKKTALGREIHLRLTPPMTPSRIQQKAERLAVAYGVARVRVLCDPLRADRVAIALDARLGVGSIAFPIEHNPVGLPLNPLRPFILGLDDNTKPVAGIFYGHHILIGGSPGAGKSNALRVFLAYLAASRHVSLYGIDPKHVELSMWKPRFTELVLGNEVQPTINLLTQLVDEIQRRATYLSSTGTATLLPSSEFPWIVLVVDEWAEMAASGDTKERAAVFALLRRYVSLGRAVSCTAILCTQRPTSEVIDTGTRSLLTDRFALRCGDKYQAEAILGIGTHDQSDLVGATVGRALWTDGCPVLPFQFFEVSDNAVPDLVCAGLSPNRRLSTYIKN
jgi:S-DNA-T family DNA segregation ATPase FtsK/SpoIIIE